eukprot:9214051-Pyramimonas_sp.AAC.1
MSPGAPAFILRLPPPETSSRDHGPTDARSREIPRPMQPDKDLGQQIHGGARKFHANLGHPRLGEFVRALK